MGSGSAKKPRRAIGETTAQDLAVIVGLPAPTHNAARAFVQAKFPHWAVVTAAFGQDIGRVYTESRAIFDFMKESCAFIHNAGQTAPPRPARLVVFYVDDKTASRLFEIFGFSALFVKLEHPQWHWPHGKHWRADFGVVQSVLCAAIERTQVGALQALRQRLQRAATDEALLLPPRNFRQVDKSHLVERFRRLQEQEALVAEAFDDLKVEYFDYDNLPQFFARVPEKDGNFRVDRRGLVFARSFSGQHGFNWLENLSDKTETTAFRVPLEGAFRFGTPVRAGFQHDVQWRGTAKLANELFEDAVTGPKSISGSHANIYASDHVS